MGFPSPLSFKDGVSLDRLFLHEIFVKVRRVPIIVFMVLPERPALYGRLGNVAGLDAG